MAVLNDITEVEHGETTTASVLKSASSAEASSARPSKPESSSTATKGDTAPPNASKTTTADITAAIAEAAAIKAMNMGELGPPKDLLRERIKNKRANEGLEDIPPEELFPKKPKYDLSLEEKDRLSERRKRNKEAAEKSRKKKKEEFEKLQSENDQLAQDKCEMAAMIETLKKDVQRLVKENTEVRTSSEALKRWIAKRAHLLGLGEKAPENSSSKSAEKGAADSTSKSVLTRGDPSLQSAAAAKPDSAADVGMSPPTPPVSPTSSSFQTRKADIPSPPPAHQQSPRLFKVHQSTSQMPRSATPPDNEFKAVGFFTPPKSKNQGLQSPWIVQQPAATDEAMDSTQPEDLSINVPEENDVVITDVTAATSRLHAPQPLVFKQGSASLMSHPQRSEEQQVIYLPKDTIFVVDNNMPAYSFGLAPQAQTVSVMTQPTTIPSAVYAATEPSKVYESQPMEILPVTYAASSLPMSMPIAVSGSGMGRVYRGDAVYTASSSPRPQKAEYRALEIGSKEVAAPVVATPAPSRLADPEVLTAIESLLKLGYKVEVASNEQGFQTVPHGYLTVSAPGLVEATGTVSLKTAV